MQAEVPGDGSQVSSRVWKGVSRGVKKTCEMKRKKTQQERQEKVEADRRS